MNEQFESILHERVDQARRGVNPCVIAKLRSGWAVLGDEQRLPGYCLLLADPIVASINDLDCGARSVFLLDMIRIGDALLSACQPRPTRINYEIAGNELPWLHGHITPRYSWEADDKRKCPPFVYRGTSKVPFDIGRDAELKTRLMMLLGAETEDAG